MAGLQKYGLHQVLEIIAWAEHAQEQALDAREFGPHQGQCVLVGGFAAHARALKEEGQRHGPHAQSSP
jgi:hypothetical protein